MSFYLRLKKFDENEARDEHGRWTNGGGSGEGEGEGDRSEGEVFVSPNVEGHMDFHGAVEGLKGARQKTMLKLSAAVNDALKLDARDSSVVGAWADGAENSVMTVAPHATFDELKTAAAMKGHIADQKAALVFKEAHGGRATLFNFHATGDLASIHKNLLADGVAFHTLVPTAPGEADVYVCDLDGSAADAVEKGAHRYGSTVHFVRGQAAFVGTSKEDGSDREQRDDALVQYERTIAGSRVQGVGSKWDRIHSAWRPALKAQLPAAA